MRILYICTGNSFRSPSAEALTRRYKADYEVESAGISPAGGIAGNVRELLGEENAKKYLKPSPEPVSGRALSEADKTVVMERGHFEYISKNFDFNEGKIENWDIEDPINPGVDPEEAFHQIKEKVRRL